MSKNKFDDLLENRHLVRMCELYCIECAEKYASLGNKQAYIYWQLVHPRDIKLRQSQIVPKPIPITYCTRCGHLSAHILKVEPLDLKYKKQKEKKELTKEQKERIKNDMERYASINGRESLHDDFLQPYWPDGEPNKEFAEKYPTQRSVTYTNKELADMGFIHEISLRTE